MQYISLLTNDKVEPSVSLFRVGIAVLFIGIAALLLSLPARSPAVNNVLAWILLALAAWNLIFWWLEKKRASVEPWMMRKDWRCGRAASDTNRKSKIFLRWIGAVSSALLVLLGLAGLLGGAGASALYDLLFVAVLAVAVRSFTSAIQASRRWRRFGPAYFQFDLLPVPPGGSLSGKIHVYFDFR